jgi:hypothetical protein
MTIRSKSDYATTIRTAITLQQEKGVKAIEESLDKSMTPNFMMVAFDASRRPFPYIFPALLKYFLENNRNKDYHFPRVFFSWVSLDPFVWDGEVLLNFTIHFS